ncbi:hypothetical protein [Thalassospira sp.]|uniref:hypothetical protein n=1 Tax=Thalassospira sp. TaxID=1912094 RepID=UPI003AA8C011
MLDATLVIGGQVFPADDPAGESYACLSIDVQAPRFTPAGERIRIERDSFYDDPVLEALYQDIVEVLERSDSPDGNMRVQSGETVSEYLRSAEPVGSIRAGDGKYDTPEMEAKNATLDPD